MDDYFQKTSSCQGRIRRFQFFRVPFYRILVHFRFWREMRPWPTIHERKQSFCWEDLKNIIKWDLYILRKVTFFERQRISLRKKIPFVTLHVSTIIVDEFHYFSVPFEIGFHCLRINMGVDQCIFRVERTRLFNF